MNSSLVRIDSHLKGLKIALLHMPPKTNAGNTPVLFLHGATFPANLSFAFQMNGSSWMDNLSDHDIESFALDFLGYGVSDRYPEMSSAHGSLTGRAMSAYLDVDKAVDYILQQTGHRQLILIGHSWGASVAALYAENYPEKLKKLVLFAPITTRTDADTPVIIERPYDYLTPDQRVQAMVDLTPTAEINQLEPELFLQWKENWLQSDITTPKTTIGVVHFPAGPSQDIEDLKCGSSYYDPAKIAVPTLVIRGEWDGYPNHNDAIQLMDSLPDGIIKKYVVIPLGTHVMHLEKSRHQLYDETLIFIAEPVNKAQVAGVAVIFEVIPHESQKQEYLDIAAELRPTLEKVDGFISIERFQSLSNPEKILSLSFWRDEQSILTWRNLELHRHAQRKGRNSIFKDYHLRIAHVVRDYGMFERREAPMDSQTYHTAY